MLNFLDKEFNTLLSENFKSAIMLSASAADDLGVQIFLIGGIVRDLLLDNSIKDIDIAVQGDAVEFAEFLVNKFSSKVIAVQENLRTAKVEFPSGVIIDFASTRQERYENSGVLPIAYNFGCSIEDDIKRRDFTINTLALGLNKSQRFKLIDFCGGYDDIINKKIRILHNKSFIDDPSRIVRALKFKIRFGFDIDNNTYTLMQSYLENINEAMPLERIKNELRQYFNIKKENIYEYLIETGSYKLICDNPIKNVQFDRLKLDVIKNLFDKDDLWVIYLSLLLVNSNYNVQRLNLSSFEQKIINEVKNLIINKPSSDNFEIYNSFFKVNKISLVVYFLITRDKNIEKYITKLKDIKVLITGDDLISLGFKPSQKFTLYFEKILREKLNGKLKTKAEEIEFIKKEEKK